MLAKRVVQQIRRLVAKEVSIAEIARQLEVSRKTIRRYAHGGNEVEKQVRPQARVLTPEVEALARRLYRADGRGSASQVGRLLRERGVAVSDRTVRRVVRDIRPARSPEAVSVSRYGFNWPGKDAARVLAGLEPDGRLVGIGHRCRFAADEQHALIEGDNLPVLQVLREVLQGSVKLAYLDPPYGAGGPIAYSNRFSDDEWLSMLFARLLVLARLLRPDGVVCLSIDERRVHHARLLLDEVFGQDARIGTLVVRTVPSGRYTAGAITNVHEYVLAYVRDPANKAAFTGVAGRDEHHAHLYKHRDDGGTYALYPLRALGDRRDRSPAYVFPVYVDPEAKTVSARRSAQHRLPVFPEDADGHGRWAWPPRRVDLDAQFLVARQSRDEWRIYRKVYGSGARARLTSMLTDDAFLARRGSRDLTDVVGVRALDGAKPVAMMRMLLEAATTTGEAATVLDLFAGSGTMGEAVLRMNAEDAGRRRYVGIQIAEATRSGSAARLAGFSAITEIAAHRVSRVRELLRVEGLRPAMVRRWQLAPGRTGKGPGHTESRLR